MKDVRTLVVIGALTGTLGLPCAANAYHEGDERIVDWTAHTLRRNEFRLGLLQLEYAPLEWLTVGTDTLPWAAKLFLPIVVPNAHVKLAAPSFGPVTLGAQVGLYYAAISAHDQNANGDVFVVPISGYGSVDVAEAWSVHLEGTYTHVWAGGGVDADDSDAHGGAVTNALQLGTMVEWRISRVVALLARGRIQPYMSSVSVTGNGAPDSYDQRKCGRTHRSQPTVAVGRALGRRIFVEKLQFRVEAGVGALFLPSLGVTLPYRGPVGDANVFFRF